MEAGREDGEYKQLKQQSQTYGDMKGPDKKSGMLFTEVTGKLCWEILSSQVIEGFLLYAR